MYGGSQAWTTDKVGRGHQNLDGLASQGGAGAAEGVLAGLDLVASVVPGEGRGDTRNAGERCNCR